MTYFGEVLKGSLADISRPESSKGSAFKGEESAVDRVKRQKNEFFTLLTTQLQHQDPTDPMDTNEITAQMFAINNVEQQLVTNQHLEEIKGYFSANQNATYLNYIGKIIDYIGDKVLVEGAKGKFDYEILEPVVSAKILIRNEGGVVVHAQEVDKKTGENSFTWEKPSHWPDGVYTFAVEALKEDASKAQVKLQGSGKVDSIISKEGGQFFDVNGLVLPIEGVLKVKDGSSSIRASISAINSKIDQLSSPIESTMGGSPNFSDPNLVGAISNLLQGK
ncbi:MAG: flagellar basal-body rod modification protein FlgD [Candidatus Midichloriaceae bacterium]|jgi:flagellar basal-body rod modification protein FlgD|nr:flagellar basal-body rod modification protein FlgD [Candidatus Midichloriaceae bacterium]